MTELYILGEAKTNPSENMTVDQAVDNISENATEILCFVAEELFDENDENELGIRIEHDSFGCKDFKSQNVDELFSYGLVTVHPISSDGIMYIHCNRDVYDSLVDFGEIV